MLGTIVYIRDSVFLSICPFFITIRKIRAQRKEKKLLQEMVRNKQKRGNTNYVHFQFFFQSAIPCLVNFNHVNIALHSRQGDGLCSFSIQRRSSSISKNNMDSSAYGQIHSSVLWSSLPSAGQNNICCPPSFRHSSILTSSIRHTISASESFFHLWFLSYSSPPRLPDHFKAKMLLPNYPACSHPPCQGVMFQYIIF